VISIACRIEIFFSARFAQNFFAKGIWGINKTKGLRNQITNPGADEGVGERIEKSGVGFAVFFVNGML